MGLSRRRFLQGSMGAAAAAGLSACGFGAGNSSTSGAASASGGASASTGPVKGSISFAFWGGSPGETKGFTYAKTKFEAANPGAKVQLKIVPYDGFFAGIDRGIQAGNAPDVFRVDYTNLGKYSSKGALLDVSPYFDKAAADAFLPALWEAVQYEGKVYGVPHQTDTTCIVYDKAAFQAAGITSVPTSLDSAWSWEEFGAAAQKLRASLPAGKFPFAYDWTKAGAFRWLSWLYQAGGTLMTDDLKKAAIPSDPATKALDFTKSFFEKKWTPDAATIKATKYSDEFFIAKTVPMTFIGDFLVPSLADPKNGYKGEWGATFMPKDQSAASDLGGNAIVVSQGTKEPETAAAFIKFLGSEDMMKYFCEQAIELPTLKSLASEDLQYAARPDLMKVFTQQAATITDIVVKETTIPAFNSVNTLLQDQLELAFRGQATDQTLQQIASGVNQALGA